jgi:hypothetical protein
MWTDVSEVRAASMIREMIIFDYTAVHPRRLNFTAFFVLT